MPSTNLRVHDRAIILPEPSINQDTVITSKTFGTVRCLVTPQVIKEQAGVIVSTATEDKRLT